MYVFQESSDTACSVCGRENTSGTHWSRLEGKDGQVIVCGVACAYRLGRADELAEINLSSSYDT